MESSRALPTQEGSIEDLRMPLASYQGQPLGTRPSAETLESLAGCCAGAGSTGGRAQPRTHTHLGAPQRNSPEVRPKPTRAPTAIGRTDVSPEGHGRWTYEQLRVRPRTIFKMRPVPRRMTLSIEEDPMIKREQSAEDGPRCAASPLGHLDRVLRSCLGGNSQRCSVEGCNRGVGPAKRAQERSAVTGSPAKACPRRL